MRAIDLWRCALTLLCAAVLWCAQAAESPAPPPTLRFGLLPIGSVDEACEAWRPFLDDVGRALHVPVTTVPVGDYQELEDAIAQQRIDFAFLSGRLAAMAVTRYRMSAVAGFTLSNGQRGNYGYLIVRRGGPIHDLHDLLSHPQHWRYARDEPLSVTGYLAPEAWVFAPRGLDSDTFFAHVGIADHQDNALAVVNGDADVAASNSPDLDLFRAHFPNEAARLRIIWRSPLIPAGVIVVRDGLPEPVRSRLIAYLRGYGNGSGAQAARERANIARIPDAGGLTQVDNSVLRPFIDMQYALLLERARHAEWTDPHARNTRLAQIDRDRERDLQALRTH